MLEAKPEERMEEKAEDMKEESKPPSPFVLFVDLHCVGCAKKIAKSIFKIRGLSHPLFLCLYIFLSVYT